MPAPDQVPVHDPSLVNLEPSLSVYGLAVESDQLEPVPDGGRPRRKRLGVGAWLAIVWLVGLLALAILAPLLPIPDPNQSFTEIARKGPTAGHWLGGDANGRDLLARLIYGTRASFAIGFGAVGFGLVIGGLLGLATGFFRGKVDGIITPIMTILLAIPQFVLALSRPSAGRADRRRVASLQGLGAGRRGSGPPAGSGSSWRGAGRPVATLQGLGAVQAWRWQSGRSGPRRSRQDLRESWSSQTTT